MKTIPKTKNVEKQKLSTLNFQLSTLLLLVIMIASIQGAYSQNSFFPAKEGMTLVYAQNNDKGKTDSYSRLTITNVEGSGDNMTITYTSEVLDKNRKPLSKPVKVPLKVTIKNGVMVMDMKQMFADQLKDEQMQVEITGVPVELPGNMEPGQSLKDAEITMSINMVIMKMNTTVKMTDGKCLAIEDVTVPAGTFKCHKITQTVTSTVMKKTVTGRTVSWYARGIGTIKTESYNDKDKLQSSTELAEVN